MWFRWKWGVFLKRGLTERIEAVNLMKDVKMSHVGIRSKTERVVESDGYAWVPAHPHQL